MPKINDIFIKIILNSPSFLLKVLFFWKKRIEHSNYYLDFKSQIILEFMPNSNLSELDSHEKIEDARKKRERFYNFYKPSRKIKNINTTEHFIKISNKNILLREYSKSNNKTKKAILYFHGGGYVFGSVKAMDNMCKLIAKKTDCNVFSLDYSLAPENKFPICLLEGMLAIKKINSFGYQNNEISLCGDSAGAHLAACICKNLAKENHDMIHSQFLIYPMCDPTCSSDSHKEGSNQLLLTTESMKWFWKKLLPEDGRIKRDDYDLLYGNDMKYFPKTIVVTAGFDVLHSEGEEFASKLNDSKNLIKQLHYPALFHGFANSTKIDLASYAVNDFLQEYKKIL